MTFAGSTSRCGSLHLAGQSGTQKSHATCAPVVVAMWCSRCRIAMAAVRRGDLQQPVDAFVTQLAKDGWLER